MNRNKLAALLAPAQQVLVPAQQEGMLGMSSILYTVYTAWRKVAGVPVESLWLHLEVNGSQKPTST